MHRGHVIDNKPVYQRKECEDIKDEVWSLWNQCHAPHHFRQSLFKLVSLHFVQSILSVMKHHAPEFRKNHGDIPLIVVISDEKQLYQNIDGLGVDYKNQEHNTSLSYLFHNEGDMKRDENDTDCPQNGNIKRIDSIERVFTLKLQDFMEDVGNKGFLHRFVSMTSLKHKETLVLFTRPQSDNLYIAHQGFVAKLSMTPNDQDLHYFLPLFVPLKVGDCVHIEAFSTPDRGTIVGLWRHTPTTIMYRIRSADNVYYMMHYHRLVNRESPQNYWNETRKFVSVPSVASTRNITALPKKDSRQQPKSMWDNVPLWKTDAGLLWSRCFFTLCHEVG